MVHYTALLLGAGKASQVVGRQQGDPHRRQLVGHHMAGFNNMKAIATFKLPKTICLSLCLSKDVCCTSEKSIAALARKWGVMTVANFGPQFAVCSAFSLLLLML